MLTREQILINKVTPKLPIKVYPEETILTKLREHFEDESISKRSEFEVPKIYDMREEGGLTCEIRPLGVADEELEKVFLCSITHFRVKRNEPYYQELEKYRLKRIRTLARQQRRGFY